MRLDFAPFSYGRPGLGLAEARTVNVFYEPQPGTPQKYALICRPALTEAYMVGVGPVVGAFSADGVFSGDRFVCSGANVYREEALLGALTLSGIARFAAYGSQLVAVSGGTVKVYNGSTFTAITIPDSRTCVDVFVLGARFFYVCSDGRIYWSALGDATTISGAFVSASSSPDGAKGALVMGNQAVIAGSQSFEFWVLSTNPDAPIVRSTGREYSRGLAALATLSPFDNGFCFLGWDPLESTCRHASLSIL